MHAMLLTVLLATGAQRSCIDCQRQPAVSAKGCHYASCGRCDHRAGCRSCGVGRECSPAGCCHVPRTCLATPFGCCPGSSRHMRGYPAFYSHYQRVYDYRRQSDYPWHSTRYQPRGFFPYLDGRPLREEAPIPHPEADGVLLEPLRIVPGSP